MAYDYYARAYMGENLDFMPDYATALKIYNDRKPYIKGKYKGERPLGNNRRHDRSRIELDGQGNVKVKHWQTNIIVYQPDGGIVLECGGWSSISTAQIMQELLGVGKICRVHCKIYYRHDDKFHYVGTKLRVNPDGAPVYKNSEYVYTPKLDVLKKYRKKYAFFLEYAKQVLTMSDQFKVETDSDGRMLFEGETLKEWYMSPLTAGSIRYDDKARSRGRDALFGYLDYIADKAEEERLQTMYDMIAPITYMMGSYIYRSQGALVWTCDNKRFKRGFEELIKHQFGSEIFKLTLASNNKPVRDPNAKYMK